MNDEEGKEEAAPESTSGEAPATPASAEGSAATKPAEEPGSAATKPAEEPPKKKRIRYLGHRGALTVPATGRNWDADDEDDVVEDIADQLIGQGDFEHVITEVTE